MEVITPGLLQTQYVPADSSSGNNNNMNDREDNRNIHTKSEITSVSFSTATEESTPKNYTRKCYKEKNIYIK